MIIAINCSFYLPKGGGIKEYIHNLVENLYALDLENKYILYVLEDSLDYAKKNLPNFQIKSIPFRSGSLLEVVKRSILSQSFWSREEDIEGFDIFHSPFFYAPHLKRAKVILTVHDMRFFRFPKTYHFLRYVFLKYSVKRSVLSADAIISISEFTKSEIISAYKINPAKITVIHEAINMRHFSPVDDSLNSPVYCELKKYPFLLSVGHLEPRKNYNRLILAFKKIKCNYPDIKLVIVGKKNLDYTKTIALINSSEDVFYLDFVSDYDLRWLYQQARLFVFPSIYEGFGFPPLEAACFGTPSAVSNQSSIPEICGDSVEYFNPFDINDLAKTIIDALSIPKDNILLQKRMKNNLSRFSWKKNVKDTIALYYRIANNEE